MQLSLLKNATDLNGKRVLLRVDFNVPIENDEVVDDFRIWKVLPTIEFLRDAGARIIVLSHHSDSAQTLHPVARVLNETYPTYFVEDIFDAEAFTKADSIEKTEGRHIVFCENLRKWPGEAANGSEFAKRLASLGDVYVNDAFSVSHREHASVVSLPMLLPSYAGFLFESEIAHLSRAFNPPHPFLFILGGAKADTKLPLAIEYLESADTVFIGGAPANNLLKEGGFEVGTSVVEETDADIAKLLQSEKVRVPIDVVVQNESGVFAKKPNEVEANDKIVDAGPETMGELEKLVHEARFALWNGPLGEYEEEGFAHGTERLIQILAESKAEKVIGGGNTVAVISKMGLEDKFPFLSTAGGAMLEFLSQKTLPGIEALKQAR